VNGQRPTARTIIGGIGGIVAVAGVAALFLLREGNAMGSWREWSAGLR
jgi:hypothetical protein